MKKTSTSTLQRPMVICLLAAAFIFAVIKKLNRVS